MLKLKWEANRSTIISLGAFLVTCGATFMIGYLPANASNNPSLQLAILNGVFGIPLLIMIASGYFTARSQ
jgi:hypothetical protein